MLLPLFFALQQATSAPVVPGTGMPTVLVPRLEQRVVIDGVLDEPVWAEAARLSGFWQYEPVDGRPAEERTEVLVWYAPDAIHFGIRAHDRQPQSIRATVADRDNISGDDYVTIYLDTFADRRRAFFFAVNPLGVQQDGVRTEGQFTPGRMFGGEVDSNPDYYFESKGRLTADGYVVEVRVPFKSLRFPSSGPQRWGLQIERKVQRTGYTDMWTAVRRAHASFLAQAGTLEGLYDLERGVVLEAQPFVTAMANGAVDTLGAFVRESLEPDAGLNLRLGFSSLSLDATLNPDFSQVESDVGQVTVNERFALFFPEKRPFFLEGIELFAVPNQLVYTRRVAQPRAGAKLTGKRGPIGVAHLTAVDQGQFGADDALVNVTRLRRDFGESSLAGVVVTDRSALGAPDYNRVLAADARVVFAQLYFVEAQLGGAWTRDSAGSRSAPLWNLMFDRTGRRWGFNYALKGLGTGFDAQQGFVPRTGIIDGHFFNRLSFYGSRGALFEWARIFMAPSRIWDYRRFGLGHAIEGGDWVRANIGLRGGWEIESSIVLREFVELDRNAYAAYEVAGPSGRTAYAPLERVSGPGGHIGVVTAAFPRFNGLAMIQYARVAIFPEGSEGNATTAGAELSLRPAESLRAVVSAQLQRITRARDGSEFARTVLPRLKLEYQPSRALFFRTVAEYRSERRAALEDARTGAPLLLDGAPAAAARIEGLRVDLLAAYEPTPGTVAFLGYGSSLEADNAFDFGGMRRSNDGFFLKLAYQFRR